MAANTAPIFTKIPDIQWGVVTAVNAAYDGTGTTVVIFTAGSADGNRIERITFRSLGTNAATVVRLFINNGSSAAVAANNTLFFEIAIASTAGGSAALPEFSYEIPIVLPSGYKIIAATNAAISSGITVTAFGGKYS